MDSSEVSPKVKRDIIEHLAMAQYAIFYVSGLLKKTKKKKLKK